MTNFRSLLTFSALCAAGCVDSGSAPGDLVCQNDKCTETYGPAGVKGAEITAASADSPGVTPTAETLCLQADALGCPGYSRDDYASCEAAFANVETWAEEQGCGEAYRTVAGCLATDAMTCDEFQPFDKTVAADTPARCETERDAYRDCLKATCHGPLEYCVSNDDGSCSVKLGDGCGNSAGASCVPAGDDRVTCTCDDGTPKAGNTFDVLVLECCDATRKYLATACGYAEGM